jgi:hypothetical protein
MLASDYVAAGLALVPIPLGQKGPVREGWNLRANTITDPERAARLTGNVGLAHAYCTPTPTMALDIDDLAQAEVWLAEEEVDLGSLLNAPDAVHNKSGMPFRIKLLYRCPEGVIFPPTAVVKSRAGPHSRTILEFRCASANGRTVQDVLPPSIHPVTGKPYQWGGRGHWSAIPTIPPQLLMAWVRTSSRQGRRECPSLGQTALFTGVEDTPRKRALVEDLLSHISADCLYPRYRNAVWAILSLGWEDVEVIARDWSLTAPHRFEEANFLNLLRDHNSEPSPTIGTLYHYAREEGWDG